jgi:hypothetical protein
MTAPLNGAIYEMIKLGPGLMIPVDRLTPALRRRWDEAHARRQNGEDTSGAIKTIIRDVQTEMGPELLLRAAHKAGPKSALDIGIVEGHGGTFTDLSEAARLSARREKKREGVKEQAGEEK